MSSKDKEDPLWWVEKFSEGGIIVGLSAIAEHWINYGRPYDEDKEVCHGKIGIGVLAVSSIARIGCAVIRAMRPKCPYCNHELAYVCREQAYYCNNCQQYVQS